MPKRMTKEEKLERTWNFIMYGAKQHIIKDLRDAEENQIEGKSEAEKNRILEQNKKARIKDGFPAKVTIANDVDRMEEYLREDVKNMLIGNGSDTDIAEGYEILGEIVARVNVEYGREYDRIRSRFGDAKLSDEKAYIVANKSQCKASHLEEQTNTLKTQMSMFVGEYIGDSKTAGFLNIFDKASQDAREKLSAEEKVLYDKGMTVKNGIDLDKDKTLKKYAEKDGAASKLAQQYERSNNARAYKELGATLVPSVTANIRKFDTANIDTLFMRGIVKDLESTGTGKDEIEWYKKMWHKTNSKTYDDMLKNIKTYIACVEASEDGNKLFMAQNKMIESIKSYISGKETVREHQFGQKRFDDVLYLLSQVMPEQEFQRTIVAPINDARHRAKDYDHDIDVLSFNRDKMSHSKDNEHGRLRRLGLEGMDEIQKATNEYQTHLPESFKKKRMENIIDRVFSQKPVGTGETSDLFAKNGTNHFKKFKPINDSFGAIGFFKYEEKLSDKDFAALGYLGTEGPVDYLLMKGNSKLDVDKISKQFEEGRQKAADALRQYEAGNKAPLAKLIADGIKRLTNNYQNSYGLPDSYISSSEMFTRAYNMMNRDPEIMKLAIDKNVGGLTKEDFANMRGVMRGANVITKAVEARDKIYAHQNGSKVMTDTDYLNKITDLETYYLMDYNMKVMHVDPKKIKASKIDNKKLLLNSTKMNLGKALGSDKDMRELRKNVMEIAVKNKMKNHSTADSKKHREDYASFDKSLGIIGGKMPQVSTQNKKPVAENAKTKKNEAPKLN